MKERYIISTMKKDEIPLAIHWAKQEGWNPGLYDAECFFKADPKGFLKGTLNGKIIAIGSAVNYDDNFAFCGFYIVDKDYRGKNYGIQLTYERLQHVGNRNAGIDGVVNMLDKYARLGYKTAHYNARYSGYLDNLNVSNSNKIVLLKELDFNYIRQYDREHFPAYRDQFLQCWINQPESLSIGFWQDKQLKGFGTIRKCYEGYKIAPLFADTPEIANSLFESLAKFAKKELIIIDIPENNEDAINLVQKYNLNKTFSTARMYLKGEPQIKLNEIYGITSFELG